jgi:hypothetical protein
LGWVGIHQYHQKRNYLLFYNDWLDVVIFLYGDLLIVNALIFRGAYIQHRNYVEVDINEWMQVFS